jgi:metal-responsive CopG/Arc/MetJ family transcriptional regulator
MKVAVSVPDPIFQAAERVSRRMRVSRSRLYANAVEAYVKQHGDDDITEQLNKVYAGSASTIDPALEAASIDVLRRETWK